MGCDVKGGDLGGAVGDCVGGEEEEADDGDVGEFGEDLYGSLQCHRQATRI